MDRRAAVMAPSAPAREAVTLKPFFDQAAQALGIRLSQRLLLRADRVVE